MHVYRRWMRDRCLSTIVWTTGLVVMVVLTVAFYPALGDTNELFAESGDAMNALLGLNDNIDPSSPLGYIWIGLYANVYPMTLIALGIALGTAAIAGDEDTGALEYLLSKPVTRRTVALSRFASAVTILLIVSFFSALSLVATAPLFDLTDEYSVQLTDGSTFTQPGVAPTDVAAGTIASFTVALGYLGVAFLIGAVTGRKGITVGVASGFALGGYVFFTLSDTTASLEWLSWFSPWRWYIDDAMLIDGLGAAALLPVALAAVCLVAGLGVFLRRDLQNP